MKSILVLALLSVVLVGSVGIADAYEGEIVLERIFHDEERFGDAFYFEGYVESDIPPTLDYTVFVTLYDAGGKIMGEFDSRLDETKSRDRGTYQWGFDFYIEGDVYELVPNTDYDLEVIYRDGVYNETLSIPPLEEIMKINEYYADNIKIEINSDSYMTGEKIIVSGNTNAQTPAMSLKIIQPNGNIVAIDQVLLDESGSFSAVFSTTGNLWKIEGIYTVIAEQGNSKDYQSSITFSFTPREFIDILPPTIRIPENIHVQSIDLNGSKVNFSVNARDEIDGDIAVSCTHNSGMIFPIGITTVTCNAKDNTGNSESKSFTITITTPDIERESTPEQIFSINPIDEIEERLASLEDKNKELLIENRDLRNQIKSLSDRIDNLLLIVQEQINVMMRLFN